MAEFIAVLMISFLTAVSPGADFAMITKNTYLYGLRAGMLTNIGTSAGILFHVSYTLFAVTTVLKYAPDLFIVVKYIGAAYLIYMGYKIFKQGLVSDTETMTPLCAKKAMRSGFFCSATNPKLMLLVISVYTQIASPTTGQFLLIGYGFLMALVSFSWYIFVIVVFSQKSLREKMLRKQLAVNKVIGVVLGFIGGSLIFSGVA